jgi:hypothetical protein
MLERLSEGRSQSVTFRALVDDLEQTNTIVYVEYASAASVITERVCRTRSRSRAAIGTSGFCRPAERRTTN